MRIYTFSKKKKKNWNQFELFIFNVHKYIYYGELSANKAKEARFQPMRREAASKKGEEEGTHTMLDKSIRQLNLSVYIHTIHTTARGKNRVAYAGLQRVKPKKKKKRFDTPCHARRRQWWYAQEYTRARGKIEKPKILVYYTIREVRLALILLMIGH